MRGPAHAHRPRRDAMHDVHEPADPDARLRCLAYLHSNALGMGWRALQELDALVYDSTNGVASAYEARMATLMYNLVMNATLRAYAPETLVAMNGADMRRGTILEHIEAQERSQIDMFKLMLLAKYDAIRVDHSKKSQLVCRMCKSRSISWTQKQTRGADESMTVFCSCDDCRHRCKMS